MAEMQFISTYMCWKNVIGDLWISRVFKFIDYVLNFDDSETWKALTGEKDAKCDLPLLVRSVVALILNACWLKQLIILNSKEATYWTFSS